MALRSSGVPTRSRGRIPLSAAQPPHRRAHSPAVPSQTFTTATTCTPGCRIELEARVAGARGASLGQASHNARAEPVEGPGAASGLMRHCARLDGRPARFSDQVGQVTPTVGGTGRPEVHPGDARSRRPTLCCPVSWGCSVSWGCPVSWAFLVSGVPRPRAHPPGRRPLAASNARSGRRAPVSRDSFMCDPLCPAAPCREPTT